MNRTRDAREEGRALPADNTRGYDARDEGVEGVDKRPSQKRVEMVSKKLSKSRVFLPAALALVRRTRSLRANVVDTHGRPRVVFGEAPRVVPRVGQTPLAQYVHVRAQSSASPTFPVRGCPAAVRGALRRDAAGQPRTGRRICARGQPAAGTGAESISALLLEERAPSLGSRLAAPSLRA